MNTLILAAYNAPQITWTVNPTLQAWSSKVAFALMIIWVAMLLMQYAVPSRRGGMGRGQMGFGKFLGAGALCVILLDLSLIPTIVNTILSAFWYLGSLFGLVG